MSYTASRFAPTVRFAHAQSLEEELADLGYLYDGRKVHDLVSDEIREDDRKVHQSDILETGVTARRSQLLATPKTGSLLGAMKPIMESFLILAHMARSAMRRLRRKIAVSQILQCFLSIVTIR